MMNNESVGKKIVEALKKQAENMDIEDQAVNTSLFEEPYGFRDYHKSIQL